MRVGALNHAQKHDCWKRFYYPIVSIVVAVAMLPDLARYMKIRAM
jgi:hypothetical protein